MALEIILGVGMFTLLVFLLVLVILSARAKLVGAGDVQVTINGEKTLTLPARGKLLQSLSSAGVFLASACGGGGTCALCRCIVVSGGGAMMPSAAGHVRKGEARSGWRRSAQVP